MTSNQKESESRNKSSLLRSLVDFSPKFKANCIYVSSLFSEISMRRRRQTRLVVVALLKQKLVIRPVRWQVVKSLLLLIINSADVFTRGRSRRRCRRGIWVGNGENLRVQQRNPGFSSFARQIIFLTVR